MLSSNWYSLTDEPLILTAKIKNGNENIVQVEVDKSQLGNVYYVYARGGLDSVWTDPAQAVLQADSRTGVVLNRAQQYVWERGNIKTQLTLNTEDVPEVIRSGSWDKGKLQEGLGALLYAGVLSCGVGYTLQIVGQKGLNPTVAALIMSLESVIATISGWIAYKIGFLTTDQTLTARQIAGCVIVFAAVILVQLPPEWFRFGKKNA